MFAVNEKVVYPGYGVAKIDRIVEKKVGGSVCHFLELNFLSKDMMVLIPTTNLSSVGIRRLSSKENVAYAFKLLAEPAVVCQQVTASNWNKRNKEYQCKLRTGNLYEICKIYRDLKHIATQKELSFGEKNLLLQTENLLAEEISLVKKVDESKAIEEIRSVFSAARSLGPAQVAQ